MIFVILQLECQPTIILLFNTQNYQSNITHLWSLVLNFDRIDLNRIDFERIDFRKSKLKIQLLFANNILTMSLE